jgi:transposase
MTALDEQTVTVPGTAAAEMILPRLADSLRDVLQRRDQVAAEVEGILDAHPLAKVLTSMPGIGVRTAARILLEVGDGTTFPTSGHLAAYAGLAPVTRRSATSIRGEHPPRGGNKQLKRAFAVCDPHRHQYGRSLRSSRRRYRRPARTRCPAGVRGR